MVKFLFYLTIGFALVVIGFGIREFRIQAQQPVSVVYTYFVQGEGIVYGAFCLQNPNRIPVEMLPASSCNAVSKVFVYDVNTGRYEKCLSSAKEHDCEASKIPRSVAEIGAEIKTRFQ